MRIVIHDEPINLYAGDKVTCEYDELPDLYVAAKQLVTTLDELIYSDEEKAHTHLAQQTNKKLKEKD